MQTHLTRGPDLFARAWYLLLATTKDETPLIATSHTAPRGAPDKPQIFMVNLFSSAQTVSLTFSILAPITGLQIKPRYKQLKDTRRMAY